MPHFTVGLDTAWSRSPSLSLPSSSLRARVGRTKPGSRS
jgi:hypothetical protein